MFGKSLMIDMYDCADGVCDDLELHYRFLEELVKELGMTPMCPPVVIHAPVRFDLEVGTHKRIRTELFPDKAGVSGWQALVESGIQIHSLEPSHFSSIDVYTCGQMNDLNVINFCRSFFHFQDFESLTLERGKKYVSKNSPRS